MQLVRAWGRSLGADTVPIVTQSQAKAREGVISFRIPCGADLAEALGRAGVGTCLRGASGLSTWRTRGTGQDIRAAAQDTIQRHCHRISPKYRWEQGVESDKAATGPDVTGPHRLYRGQGRDLDVVSIPDPGPGHRWVEQ